MTLGIEAITDALPRAYPIGEDSEAPQFFLRFEDESRASAAGRWLGSLGYEVDVNRGALRRQRWTVAASGEPRGLDFDQAAKAFRRWAPAHGGTYRGRRRSRPLVATIRFAVVVALGQMAVERYVSDATVVSHLLAILIAIPIAVPIIALIERHS